MYFNGLFAPFNTIITKPEIGHFRKLRLHTGLLHRP